MPRPIGNVAAPPMSSPILTSRRRAVALAVVCALAGALILAGTHIARGAGLGSLESRLGQERAHQSQLSASLGNLAGLISSLDGQITLVERREAEVRVELAAARVRLLATRAQLTRERARLARLRNELRWAENLLAGQLRSSYENARPSLVSVVLSAGGFSQLLDQLQYLGNAEHQQQRIIAFTRRAKAEAHAAAVALARLQTAEQSAADAAAQRVAALAGMNALLGSRQAALSRAREAQQAALAASRARGRQLEGDIARVQAEQAAAERAAAAASTPTPTPTVYGSSAASGGWAIPYAIVLCESGGQNLTPNSAGASGYYQIVPGTWRLFGGNGPAAYLASKSEQDAVAARIWNGGAGASNWVCASIVGIR
jgi:septal ring factor EnvC (AmiA/AmiB activator)